MKEYYQKNKEMENKYQEREKSNKYFRKKEQKQNKYQKN